MSVFVASLFLSLLPAAVEPSGYCVVVSEATHKDPAWKGVVEALVAKHHAETVPYRSSVDEALGTLQTRHPRYVCFVAQAGEATRDFVARVSRLMRGLDDDPYPDALWGILTGSDAACALRIARQTAPLEIHRVAAGTEIALSACDEGVWYCELNQGKMVRKERGREPRESRGPPDTTQALADALNGFRAQLFVTSGHATERDWQIGYRYRNGQFRSAGGQLYGLDTAGKRYDVRSDNPKVYLPVGNCLMGHIDGADAMALAFLNSAGVCQMIGYTVPTWYGYGGWGLLDYFVEQPGRYSLAEAFFVNQVALTHRLEKYFPGAGAEAPAGSRPRLELSAEARAVGLTANDARGLLYDRDTVAFYGDPGWVARMAPGPLRWQQSLDVQGDRYRFTIRPQCGAQSFQPVNTNGSQRGGRPIVQLLPRRIDASRVKVVAGAELAPVIADDFVLVPLPRPAETPAEYQVLFHAPPTGPTP
jgi:zinc protease